MIFRFILIILLISSNLFSQKMDKITIIGTAENSKAGAIVITKDKVVYYLEGISSWNDEILRKNVEVKGNLVKEFHQEEDLMNENGEYKQGLSGEINKILKPSWKLVIKTDQKDKVLEKLKESLPINWTMKLENDSLIIGCKEQCYILFENKINAPFNKETPTQKEERFKKYGNLINQQFVFALKTKLSEKEINQIKLGNSKINEAIGALQINLKNIPTSYKDGKYWPRNKEEEKLVSDYEKEKSNLESKSIKLPDYQSEKYALYLESETGLENEFISVFPEKFSEEMYKIKFDIFGMVLGKIE